MRLHNLHSTYRMVASDSSLGSDLEDKECFLMEIWVVLVVSVPSWVWYSWWGCVGSGWVGVLVELRRPCHRRIVLGQSLDCIHPRERGGRSGCQYRNLLFFKPYFVAERDSSKATLDAGMTFSEWITDKTNADYYCGSQQDYYILTTVYRLGLL